MALGFVLAAAVVGAAGCDASVAEGETIGPRGGLVSSADGRVTLEVPAGALVDSIALSVVPTEAAPEDAIGPSYSIEPFGVTFLAPVQVRYDVADRDMDDPTTVRLVTERDDGWDALADHRIDEGYGELRASLLFSAAIAPVQ